MKIYTVMPASFTVTADEDATVFIGTSFMPEVFDVESDAIEAAQRLARQYNGQQVWIVHGEVSEAYSCEPLPVVAKKPTVQVML